MSANRDGSDDTGSLRRFAVALVRDDRFVPDDATAGRLVDKLMRQTSVTAVGEGAPARGVGRQKLFARFVQLYRRHVRRLVNDESEGLWSEAAAVRTGPAIVDIVRALSLELREALLLVVLEDFSYEEAAQALDIPLTQLVDRLDRARARLEEQMGAQGQGPRNLEWVGAPHLRVIK